MFFTALITGLNLTLKDNHLVIEPSAWLKPIADGYPPLQESYLKVGTNEKANSKVLNAEMERIFESWRGIVTTIGHILQENSLVFIR